LVSIDKILTVVASFVMAAKLSQERWHGILWDRLL